MTNTDITELSLEEFLVGEGAPEGFTSEPETFAINNDDEALWAMRRLAQASRRVAEVKRQAQVEIDRINRWVEANTAGNVRTVEMFDRLLGQYLSRVRDNDADGRKSLSFPDGTVTSRNTPSKVEVTDLDAFIAWAEANGHEDWVRIKREVNLSEVKRGVDYEADAVLDPVTGLPIQGLLHVAGGVATSVKVAE